MSSIQGTVIHVGDIQSGEAKANGNPWRKQVFAIETYGQYPKKVAFELFNDAIDKADPNIEMGKEVDVHYNLESKEYQGRWFTEAKAWKVLAVKSDDEPEEDDLP